MDVAGTSQWADIFDVTTLGGGDPTALPPEALDDLEKTGWLLPERVEAAISRVVRVPVEACPLTYKAALYLLQERHYRR